MKALLIIDYINEIVNPDGALAAKGYAEQVESRNTIENLNDKIAEFKENGYLVVYSALGFETEYPDHPVSSPIFGKAAEFGILEHGSWSSDIDDRIDFDDEFVFEKSRVSAFFDTDLEGFLEENDIEELFIAGVSTDLAVESAVRDAHDRDYAVNVLENCCAAACKEDHDNSIRTMSKIANIIK